MTEVAVTSRGFRQGSGRHKTLLAEHGLVPRYPDLDRPLTGSELAELVKGCDAAILGLDDVDRGVFEVGSLRVVVRYGTGMDKVDLEAARDNGVIVSRTPGANSVSVAELAVALMLAVARRLPAHDRNVRAGVWQRVGGIELAGRRLGLVGLGLVGREVARRCSALGMDVVAHDPVASEAPVPLVTFSELIATSDVVSIHCPRTEATAGLFSESVLRAMRPGSILINTARGGIVDEAALVAVLTEGHLWGAGIDCFAQEPLTDSALAGLDNAVLSPHCGATTTEAAERAGVMAVQEILRALAGEPMLHRVV